MPRIRISTLIGSGGISSSSAVAAGEGESLSFHSILHFPTRFAAVSLSIAWGGFAERAKLSAYLVFTVIVHGRYLSGYRALDLGPAVGCSLKARKTMPARRLFT